MKTFIGILIFAVGLGLFATLVIILKPHVCIEEQNEYVWYSWAGNPKYLGTDLQIAKEMAGNKPISIITNCVKYK